MNGFIRTRRPNTRRSGRPQRQRSPVRLSIRAIAIEPAHRERGNASAATTRGPAQPTCVASPTPRLPPTPCGRCLLRLPPHLLSLQPATLTGCSRSRAVGLDGWVGSECGHPDDKAEHRQRRDPHQGQHASHLFQLIPPRALHETPPTQRLRRARAEDNCPMAGHRQRRACSRRRIPSSEVCHSRLSATLGSTGERGNEQCGDWVLRRSRSCCCGLRDYALGRADCRSRLRAALRLRVETK